MAGSSNPLHTHLGGSSQWQEGVLADLPACLWYQHLQALYAYVTAFKYFLLLPSKRLSTAVCEPAAGAAVAAQLLNADGMTRLPDQTFSAVKYDVALLHGQTQWHSLGDHQLLLLCHKQGS
jgi:hypothetical protein